MSKIINLDGEEVVEDSAFTLQREDIPKTFFEGYKNFLQSLHDSTDVTLQQMYLYFVNGGINPEKLMQYHQSEFHEGLGDSASICFALGKFKNEDLSLTEVLSQINDDFMDLVWVGIQTISQGRQILSVVSEDTVLRSGRDPIQFAKRIMRCLIIYDHEKKEEANRAREKNIQIEQLYLKKTEH